MARYVEDTVGGHNVTIELRKEAGFSTRYAAQVSCPLKDCHAFYNAENRSTPGSAKTAVKASLKKHLNEKHK